jgi:WD40-like Beta Propeller Repeat
LGIVTSASPAAAANRYDPRLRFRTIRTAHFDIHAHQGEERLAAHLASLVERVRTEFEPVFGVARGRVQIILVNQTDVSNGYATPFPYDTIEIVAVAPASETLIGNASDWLEVAFTHEYTHILHLDRTRGFMEGARRVFGRAPLVFSNSYLPIWQIEGLAVFEESRMTGEGRIPEGDFRAIVDVAAVHGRFEPIDRAGGGLVAWPAGEAPYAYGAYFHQYLADQYGSERLSRLADATAGRLPLFGDGAFKTIFGRSSSQLWADFRAARERAVPAESATDVHATRLTHAGYDVTALDVGEDGVIRYAASDADRFPSLMALRPGGTPRRIAWRAGGTRTSARGGWVIFDQLEMVRSIALYGDLYAVRVDGGRVYRLTHEVRAGDPDLAAHGGIVCTILSSSQRALALVDFDPSVPRASAPRIIANAPDDDYTGPRWSPDGGSIAAARRRPGSYDIVVIDPATGAVRSIVSRTDARLVTPSWTPDGRTILFAANIGEAPFNVFAVDVATGAVRQVTDTVGGAQFPTLSPSGTLTYIGYTPDGYDVFSIATNPTDWTPVAFDSANPQTGSSGPGSAGSGPESAGSGSIAVPYAPLRTLAPTFWQPVIRTEAGETQFGAGTSMYDALGRHTYAANASWSGARARPDWDASYVYDRWRPALFATYSDNTDPIRGGEFRARELVTGALLPFRRVRRSETLMAGFDAEEDTIAAEPGFEFGDTRRRIRALRAGWLHDSRRQFGYSIGSEEGLSVEAAAEMNRTALGSDADGGAAILDVRGFHRIFSPHAVFAARVAMAGSWGPEDDRRVFSAAGPGAAAPVFDFGRDTIGLLRGFNPEDVVGSRTAVANLDLRFPLWRIERGPGTLPVFLRIVHAAVFADAGNAWASHFRAADVRSSAGAELSVDTTLAHYFPYSFATGVAWTHDPVAGISGLQLFGRIGYGF